MTPEDFRMRGYWRQGTRGPTRDDRRPIYRIEHPKDTAFYAEITLSPPSWRWHAHGRVAIHSEGHATRKRVAMHQAITALQQAYDNSQPATRP